MEQAPLVRRIVWLLRHSDNATVRADRVRDILAEAYNDTERLEEPTQPSRPQW